LNDPAVPVLPTFFHVVQQERASFVKVKVKVKAKVKVKLTLEQSMKAQRGSRDIALIFL